MTIPIIKVGIWIFNFYIKMAGKLGKFQRLEFSHWMGLTSDNHLGSIFPLQPQKATNLMVQLLAFYRGKSLNTFLSQFPKKEFDSDEDFYWDVIGSSRRNIPLLEARDENGNVVEEGGPNVGIGTAPFYLVFSENWFADGEVIVGNLNQTYPIRILGDAKEEGTNYTYKCEMMGGITSGIPAERLLSGERFSIEFAPVEREGSRRVGDIRFSTPVSMRNEWTTIRIHHKVWGNKMNKKLAFGIPMVRNVDGKQVKDVSDKWMHYVDWELENQFDDYKNHALAFGTSNRNANGEYLNIGKSGNVIEFCHLAA